MSKTISKLLNRLAIASAFSLVSCADSYNMNNNHTNNDYDNPWLPKGSRAAARHYEKWGRPEPEPYKTPEQIEKDQRLSEALFIGGMGLMFGGNSSGNYSPPPSQEIPDYTPPPAPTPAPDPWDGY
jgi:hypothetical protein